MRQIPAARPPAGWRSGFADGGGAGSQRSPVPFFLLFPRVLPLVAAARPPMRGDVRQAEGEAEERDDVEDVVGAAAQWRQ